MSEKGWKWEPEPYWISAHAQGKFITEVFHRDAICPVSGGPPCAKSQGTYGEPCYCRLPDFHKGNHVCKNCGRSFNQDSNATAAVFVRRADVAEKANR